MYRQNEQKEVLELLKAMDQKITNLETRIEKMSAAQEKAQSNETESSSDQSDEKQESKMEHKNWDNSMRDLSQMQYELSHELTSGIERLKKMINQSEKVVLDAKKQS